MDREHHIKEFLRLFNAREFFEAHDVLEEFWQEYGEEDRTFYQGLIQVAVALEHAQRGNHKGARGVLNSSRGRLQPYLPQYEGFDLALLLQRAARCIEDGEEPPQLPDPRPEGP
jgi:predicted metal-dependent hydrolase